jgi:hypothetical protein
VTVFIFWAALCLLFSTPESKSLPTLIPLGAESPSEETLSHQDLLRLRPKESNNSSNSSREFSLPTVTPSAISPSLLGKSGFTISRILCARSRATQNSEPRTLMGQRSTLLPYQGFPYREIAACDVNNLTFQTPSPEVSISQYNATWSPLVPVVLHCHVTFGISWIVNLRGKCSLVSRTPIH